jgi:shikimate kinase
MSTSPMRVISLIGYRGSGKSSAAPLLAERLGWEWVDVDNEVELLTGHTIRHIFEYDGEIAFRDIESVVLSNICFRDHVVIATGGGAVLKPENRQRMREVGAVVWLQASIQTLWQRICSDPRSASLRPALTNRDPMSEIELLLSEREPLYAEAATLVVNTDGLSVERIVDEILMEIAPLVPRETRA